MGAMAVVLKRREPWYDLRLCAAGKGGYRGEVRQGIDQCPRARNVAAPNKLVAHLKHKGRTVMLSKVRVDTATDYADYRSLLRGIRAGHGIREGERVLKGSNKESGGVSIWPGAPRTWKRISKAPRRTLTLTAAEGSRCT